MTFQPAQLARTGAHLDVIPVVTIDGGGSPAPLVQVTGEVRDASGVGLLLISDNFSTPPASLAPQSIASGQIMRLIARATSPNPCDATLGFRNAGGARVGPEVFINLRSGEAKTLALDASALALGRGQGALVQPVAQIVSTPTASRLSARSARSPRRSLTRKPGALGPIKTRCCVRNSRCRASVQALAQHRNPRGHSRFRPKNSSLLARKTGLKETAMNIKDKHFSGWMILAIGFAVMAATACHPGSSEAKAREQTQAAAQASAPNHASHANPALDLNCMSARIANPAEAFHYSYNRVGHSDSVKLEADVTPNSIDGVLNTQWGGDPSPPLPVHAARSDSDGWSRTLGNLNAAFGMPSSLMQARLMQGSLAQEANERVNGYDSIRYSVDTARLDAADRAMLGGPEKGTLWVGAGGCPVKWSIVTEIKTADGSIDRTHWEGNVTKK